jgi:hypothetical protein
MTGTFEWNGHTLDLLDTAYNTTILNERSIEVPIAEAWHFDHEEMDPRILEVGNVLQHYGWGGHRVVDLYEEADGVENLDVRDIQGEYDRIIAISTLEHVDQEKLSKAPIDALQHLYSLLAVGGRMLVTVPFGQQPYLDVAILEGELHPFQQWTMTRSFETGLWTERPNEAVWGHARENGWASAVWIAEWINY